VRSNFPEKPSGLALGYADTSYRRRGEHVGYPVSKEIRGPRLRQGLVWSSLSQKEGLGQASGEEMSHNSSSKLERRRKETAAAK